MGCVLVIEDEPAVRAYFAAALESGHYTVRTASCWDDAQSMLETGSWRPDVVVLDYMLPDRSGLEVIELLKRRTPELPVVVLSGQGNEEVAVRFLKLGAADYLSKPVRPETLVQACNQALAAAGRDTERRKLQTRIVGQSDPIVRLREQIERYARSDEPVLIEGESGTGKELVASSLHELSWRRSRSLVSESCAALPDPLLESELFGHKRGAFTGADRDRMGLFESAEGGSIFLDEIGETSPLLQKKLLRVLQEKEVRRVGENRPVAVDVRVIAATNRPLRELVEEGKFRQDLYYRINVLRIGLPPLRERSADIPLLIEHFLAQIARETRTRPCTVSPEAVARMTAYAWPGNVRELENELRRLVVVAEDRIEESHLSSRLRQSPVQVSGDKLTVETDSGRTLPEILSEVERAVILQKLKSTRWNRTRSARELGISRNTLLDRIQHYELDRRRKRA